MNTIATCLLSANSQFLFYLTYENAYGQTFGANSKKLIGYNHRHSRTVIINRTPLWMLFNWNSIRTASEIDDRMIAIIVVRLITADSL